MSSCLYSTIFINRGTRRTLCVHEKNDDDDDDEFGLISNIYVLGEP